MEPNSSRSRVCSEVCDAAIAGLARDKLGQDRRSLLARCIGRQFDEEVCVPSLVLVLCLASTSYTSATEGRECLP
jgi:hypothetical protein